MFDFVLWTPAWKDLDAATMASVERFRFSTRFNYFWQPFTGDALIGRARSVSLTLFLKDNVAPHLVFLDSDIVFHPDHLNRLVERLKEGYDLIGGTYVVRDGSQPASYSWDAKPILDGEIHDVEYLATGFMGISRKLVERMVKKLKLPLLNKGEFCECYPFFESGRCLKRKGKPIYISEDWDFSNKARQVGVKVYLDTGIQVGHVGRKVWTVEDMIEIRKNKASAPKEEAEKENNGTAS